MPGPHMLAGKHQMPDTTSRAGTIDTVAGTLATRGTMSMMDTTGKTGACGTTGKMRVNGTTAKTGANGTTGTMTESNAGTVGTPGEPHAADTPCRYDDPEDDGARSDHDSDESDDAAFCTLILELQDSRRSRYEAAFPLPSQSAYAAASPSRGQRGKIKDTKIPMRSRTRR